MALDRRLLIIGNAVLFSAFGCDDTADTDVEVGVGADAATTDGSPDEGAPPDLGVDPPDEAVSDVAPPLEDFGADDLGADDMSVFDDLGADDMSPLDDLGPPDLGPADLGDPDLAPPLDAEPIDAEPIDAEPIDLGPDPDMAMAPDLLPPDAGGAMTCADLMGQACDLRDEGCCVDGNPQAVCWANETGGLSWQPIPGDFFCNCIPNGDGREVVICAVPGFVGIARAGRRRPAAPSLRALARRWA